jgi:hypothetical protein
MDEDSAQHQHSIDSYRIRFIDADTEKRYRRFHDDQRYPWVKWKLLSVFVSYIIFCAFTIFTAPWHRPALLFSLALFGLICGMSFLQPPQTDDQLMIKSVKAFWQRNWRRVLCFGAAVLFSCIILMLNRYDGDAHAEEVCACADGSNDCELLTVCRTQQLWSRALQLTVWLVLILSFLTELTFWESVQLAALLFLLFMLGLILWLCPIIDAWHGSGAQDKIHIFSHATLVVLAVLPPIYWTRYTLEITARVAFKHEGLKNQRMEDLKRYVL